MSFGGWLSSSLDSQLPNEDNNHSHLKKVVTVRQLIPGQSYLITGFQRIDKAYRRRLMAMGMTCGTRITVVRLAPLGDPVELAVRGSNISVRQAELQGVNMELCDAD